MKNYLILLSLYFALPCFSFSQTLELKGLIIDSIEMNGIPMAKLRLIQDDSVFISSLTDFEGHFTIKNLKKGVYELHIQALGYKDWKSTIDLKLPVTNIQCKLTEDTFALEPHTINWGEGFILIQDSLGNSFCIDGSKNQLDSLGMKQGPWVEYFMDYSDTNSPFTIGQKLGEGEYQNDKKQGKWIYFLPNGEIDRIEYFEDGFRSD
ncbi:carboxypeptidase-like regulatory domain-containing protein [Croceimicrobium sp.]|uniref:carboxypeptidase-like regulatory domain-containing protein n=1 Tax=Croceimicrobium sp. TaxID=2828340 RepID=UPI003BAA753E